MNEIKTFWEREASRLREIVSERDALIATLTAERNALRDLVLDAEARRLRAVTLLCKASPFIVKHYGGTKLGEHDEVKAFLATEPE